MPPPRAPLLLRSFVSSAVPCPRIQRSLPPSSLPHPSLLPSSPLSSRLRRAIVSLQPLHTTCAEASFVSRLSFGSRDVVFFMLGQPLCALTIL